MHRRVLDAFFLMLLFEGAVRRYLAPGLALEIQVLRDVLPFAALIVFLATQRRKAYIWPVAALTAPLALYLLIGLLQTQNANIPTPVVSLLGIRTHFAYVPLLFLAPVYLRNPQELFVRLAAVCILAVPIAGLGVMQSVLPASHPVNAGMDPTGFGVGELIRATGTFSYISGFATFAQFAVVAGVSILLSRPVGSYMGLIGFIGLCAGSAGCLASGSRGAVVGAALESVIIIGALFMTPYLGRIAGRSFRIFAAVGLVVALAAAAIPAIVDAFLARTELAATDVDYRVQDSLFEWVSVLERFPEGNGIGMAHQQAGLWTGGGIGFSAGYEVELSRVAYELGVLGFAAFALFRLATIGVLAMALLRVPQIDLAICVALALSVVCINITGGVYSPMANALFWMAAGAGRWFASWKSHRLQLGYAPGRSGANIAKPLL